MRGGQRQDTLFTYIPIRSNTLNVQSFCAKWSPDASELRGLPFVPASPFHNETTRSKEALQGGVKLIVAILITNSKLKNNRYEVASSNVSPGFG